MWLKQSQVDQEEENLRQKMRNFSDSRRAFLFKRFKNELKDPDTYAALNWSLVAGLHHFYLGQWLRAIVEFGVFIFGIFLLINDFQLGLLLILVTLVIEFVELTRSQITVQNFNNHLMQKIIDDPKSF